MTARSHFEHIVTEGLKAADEVLIVPSGLWSAVDGALRPGVAALAAHLVGAGTLVKIAPSLCAALPATLSASLWTRTHSRCITRDLDLHRAYPSQLDGGQAFTLGLQRVMAEYLTVSVNTAARADTERAEEATRAHVHAASSAGGRATVASHGPQLANGGKATVASHGPQLANGGKQGGKATVASHGPQLGNGGRSSAGGRGKLGKIYPKPGQTAHQQAAAEKKRKERAAKRAAEAEGQ